jgi:hypothetical protein
MTLRQTRNAVRSGRWVLAEGPPIGAPTEFQRQRLQEAASAARLYLGKDVTVREMGTALGVSPERAAQLVRLGLTVLRQAGWLRPVCESTPS